ncbi:hypothetical protein C8J57DRAFT_1225902 [Mycena rebaudengoi]|nr:hypothetical protein C8J57DRAFT_1225902 [Mycena rebaudengoi]
MGDLWVKEHGLPLRSSSLYLTEFSTLCMALPRRIRRGRRAQSPTPMLDDLLLARSGSALARRTTRLRTVWQRRVICSADPLTAVVPSDKFSASGGKATDRNRITRADHSALPYTGRSLAFVPEQDFIRVRLKEDPSKLDRKIPVDIGQIRKQQQPLDSTPTGADGCCENSLQRGEQASSRRRLEGRWLNKPGWEKESRGTWPGKADMRHSPLPELINLSCWRVGQLALGSNTSFDILIHLNLQDNTLEFKIVNQGLVAFRMHLYLVVARFIHLPLILR